MMTLRLWCNYVHSCTISVLLIEMALKTKGGKGKSLEAAMIWWYERFWNWMLNCGRIHRWLGTSTLVPASNQQASQADSLGALRFLGSVSLPSRGTWVAQFWGTSLSLPTALALAPALECQSVLGWHVSVPMASLKLSAPCVPVWHAVVEKQP